MVGWILSVKYQRDDNTFGVADYMIYRTEGNRYRTIYIKNETFTLTFMSMSIMFVCVVISVSYFEYTHFGRHTR